MPVSGRKPLAGSSVVIRHCSAAPCRCDVVLGQAEVGQGLARRRSASARLHQVDVGDLLGHRVLDLDARVHLDEARASPSRVEQELDGAGVDVADLPGEARRRRRRSASRSCRVEVRRRRDLDDLLVAPLHRAVALEEVDDVAVRVGEDLHLDVARVDDGLLEEHRRVAERATRPRASPPRATPRRSAGVVDPAHAAPAAAGDGLDEQREADARRPPRSARRRRSTAATDVEHRHAGRPGRRDRARLVAGQLQHVRPAGPMKVMPGVRARLRRARGSPTGSRSRGRSRRRRTRTAARTISSTSR